MANMLQVDLANSVPQKMDYTLCRPKRHTFPLSYLRQVLTDFHISFTGTLGGKSHNKVITKYYTLTASLHYLVKYKFKKTNDIGTSVPFRSLSSNIPL